MYLQIILKSGRTMLGGLTETMIEVNEVGLRKISSKGFFDENAFPTISWREKHQTGFMEPHHLLALHDGDHALLKSKSGNILCIYRGEESSKQRRERIERSSGENI